MAKLQNIKGMRDHLGQAMLLRQHIVAVLTQVAERHGFEPLQTPVVEYAELLEGKLGDDEKLIYRFEDNGGRRLALRYDQTVPLARVVAQYAGQLVFPWRRYAYGPSYRGERPARGRYREFYQFDADIVGSASPLADAEIVAILTESLEALGFPGFTTLLNHRQVIGGIARASGLDEAEASGADSGAGADRRRPARCAGGALWPPRRRRASRAGAGESARRDRWPGGDGCCARALQGGAAPGPRPVVLHRPGVRGGHTALA